LENGGGDRLRGTYPGSNIILKMKQQLAEFITSQILKDPARTLTDDEALISSGLIDSFSLVDLALFVEDTFAVRIDDSELTADVFDTLSELTALVKSRKAS
jgi:acyl carrier protein